MHATDPVVHEELQIDAEPGAVWRAWTEPSWLTGWMVESAEGTVAPGSALRWRWDSLGLELELSVVDVDPPRRLVLRGGPTGRPPQTQTISLHAAGGGTRVELEHTGFSPGAGDERAGTAAGWRAMLRVLAHYLAGPVGRRRECAAVLAPIAAPLAAIGDLLHTPEGRAAWLVDGASPPLATEGERFSLRAPGGAAMSGRVLALAPPFQLALGWDEADGVLVLRAIQVAPAGAPGSVGAVLAGAQAWSWSPDRPAWRSARELLETAVARLVRAAGGTSGAA